MQSQATTSQATRLGAGQSFHLQATAGSCIVVKSGRIEIVERSIWLCDRFVAQGATVRDGEQYTLRQSGWIALQAREPAVLFYMEDDTQEDVGRRLFRLLASAARSLRRAFGRPA
jgi:hypothetical protein